MMLNIENLSDIKHIFDNRLANIHCVLDVCWYFIIYASPDVSCNTLVMLARSG